MKPRKGTFPIHVRLILTLLPLLLIVLAVFGVFCNALYQSKIEEEISRQLQLQVDAVAYQLDNTISESNRLALMAYADEEMREGLEKALEESFTFQDRVALHEDVLEPLFSVMASPEKYLVQLYPLSENVFCDQRYIFSPRYFPDAALFEDLVAQGYGRNVYHVGSLYQYYDTKSESVKIREGFYISRAVFTSDRKPLGVISAMLYNSYLESILETIVDKNGPYYYALTLKDGQPLFSKGEWQEDMLTISSQIAGGNLRMEVGITSNAIAQQTVQQTRMLLLFGGLMLLMAAVLIIFTCRRIIAPLHGVARKFRRLNPGEPLVEEPRSGMDEAALIDQTFTSVYRAYYKSVQDQEEMEENQRRLEINLLLSRINPHFLYNTLSGLRWSMPPEERPVVDRLVAYYRGMLGQGRETASLGREMGLIEQFIDLHSYTYSREIVFHRDVAEELETLMIPKFLLQPVVENALKFHCANPPLTISAAARLENGALVITIENNAAPIEEQVRGWLNALNDQDRRTMLRTSFNSDETGGYGIFNVIMRIRLLCGPGYGLWHELPEGGGTRARFILPATRDAELFLHKKDA